MAGPPPQSWAVEPGEASAQPIVEGLWRLRLPMPWSAIPHVNAYALAHADGGITLVDCGTAGDPTCWDALVVALADAGWTVADVRTVVLTHYHSDHAGLAARLVDETGCEVLGHLDHAHFTDALLRPREIAAARERRARQEGVPDRLLPGYRTVREEVEGVLAPVLPDTGLGDGDVVPSALGDWSVVHTPGHAPSHVCLHQRERSILIVGDLLAAAFHPWFDYGYSEDPVAEMRASFDRVEALLPIDHVLPGHGRPLPDPAALIDDWRRALGDGVEEVWRAVVGDPGSSAYKLMERIHGPDDGSEAGPWHLTTVATYLRHLRLVGRVERTVDGDGRFGYVPAVGAAAKPAG